MLLVYAETRNPAKIFAKKKGCCKKKIYFHYKALYFPYPKVQGDI